VWTHTQDAKLHQKQHSLLLIRTLYTKTVENFRAHWPRFLTRAMQLLGFSITAASVTWYFGDATKWQFCGQKLTLKSRTFSVRALNTEGWQKRDPTIPKTTDTLSPKADLGGVGVLKCCLSISMIVWKPRTPCKSNWSSKITYLQEIYVSTRRLG